MSQRNDGLGGIEGTESKKKKTFREALEESYDEAMADRVQINQYSSYDSDGHERVKKIDEYEIKYHFCGAGKKDKRWENENLEGQEFQRYRFSAHNLNGAIFRYADLSRSTFENSLLNNTEFHEAILEETDFRDNEMRGARFTKAKMDKSSFIETDLEGSSFAGASLQQANFTGANLRNTDFTGANLYYADFNDADLTGANFKGAHFFPKKELLPENLKDILDAYAKQYRFSGSLRYLLNDMAADLIRKIRGIEPAKEKMRLLNLASEHPLFASYRDEQSLFLIYKSFVSFPIEKKYKERSNKVRAAIAKDKGEENGKAVEYHGTDKAWNGVELWWMNLKNADFRGANLKGAVFSGSNLDNANFSPIESQQNKKDNIVCRLRGARFNYASLKRANFVGAKLLDAEFKHANFNLADLTFAEMESVKMEGASLVSAVLINANLAGADLRNADFNGALLWHTNLKNAELKGAKLADAHFFPHANDLNVKELKRFLKKYERMYLKGGVANNIKELQKLMREDLLKKIYQVYLNRGISEADDLLKIYVTHAFFDLEKKDTVKKRVAVARKEMLDHYGGVVKASKDGQNQPAYLQLALTSDIRKIDIKKLERAMEVSAPENEKKNFALSAINFAMNKDSQKLEDLLRINGKMNADFGYYPGELYINLCGADLRNVNLTNINLTHVNLCNANLKGVDLTGTQFFVDDDLVRNFKKILDSYQLHYGKSKNLAMLQHAMAIDLINKIRDIEPIQNKQYLLDRAMRHPFFSSYKNIASPFIPYKKIVGRLIVGNLRNKQNTHDELYIEWSAKTNAAIKAINEKKAAGQAIEFHGNYTQYNDESEAFKGAELVWMDIPNADFRGAIVMAADFSGSILKAANFSPYPVRPGENKSKFFDGNEEIRVPARLGSACFDYADLEGASFESALMNGTKLNHANLTGANLNEANMVSNVMNQTEMRESNLTGATLVKANLAHASLVGSTFKGADLRGAHFAKADMKNVDLTNAKLQYTNFNGANIEGVNFKGANFFPATNEMSEQSLKKILDFYNEAYFKHNPSNNLKVLRKLMRRELFEKIAEVYNQYGFVRANELLTIAMEHPYFAKHRNGAIKKNKPTYSQLFFKEGQSALYQHLKHRVKADKDDMAAYANWALVTDVRKLDKDRVAQAYAYASEKHSGFTKAMRGLLSIVHAYLTGVGLQPDDIMREHLQARHVEHVNRLPFNFVHADLSNYNLSGYDFRNAYLLNANLMGADLTGANLRGAILEGANLKDVQFFPLKAGLIRTQEEFDIKSVKKYLDLYHEYYLKNGVDKNCRLLRKKMREEILTKIAEISEQGRGYIDAVNLLSIAESHPFFTTNLDTLKIKKGKTKNKRVFAKLRKRLDRDLQQMSRPETYIHSALFSDISKRDLSLLEKAHEYAIDQDNEVPPSVRASIKATFLAFNRKTDELWNYMKSNEYKTAAIDQKREGIQCFPNFHGADLSGFDFSACDLVNVNLYNANIQDANFRQAKFINDSDLMTDDSSHHPYKNLNNALQKFYEQYAKSRNFPLLRKALLNSVLSRLRNEDLPVGGHKFTKEEKIAILQETLSHPLFATHRHVAMRKLNEVFSLFGNTKIKTESQRKIDEEILQLKPIPITVVPDPKKSRND